MDEDKIAQAMAKAQHASELLNSEAFNQKIDKLQAEMVALVFATNDTAERQRCVDLYRAFDRIKEELKTDVSNGNEARRQLEHKHSGVERKQFGVV